MLYDYVVLFVSFHAQTLVNLSLKCHGSIRPFILSKEMELSVIFFVILLLLNTFDLFLDL